MIKQSYSLFQRIVLSRGNFSGLMRFQNMASCSQKQKLCYGFYNWFTDQQVDNFEKVLIVEQSKLQEEINKMKNLTPEEKDLIQQTEIVKRLDEYQESAINKDGSYSKDFAVSIITTAFQFMFVMSLKQYNNKYILITENMIPSRLINILQRISLKQETRLQKTGKVLKQETSLQNTVKVLKQETSLQNTVKILKQETSLQNTVKVLKILKESFELYKFQSFSSSSQLKKMINQNCEALKNMKQLGEPVDIFLNHGIQLTVVYFYATKLFSVINNAEEEQLLINSAFNQLSKMIKLYKEAQNKNGLEQIVQRIINLHLLPLSKGLRYFQLINPTNINLPLQQRLIEIVEQLSEYYQPLEILNLKIQFKDVLAMYKTESEIKKLQQDIDSYMKKHNLSYDKSMKLILKLVDYRFLKRGGSIDQISKELDEFDVNETDDIDCQISWYQYQEMQFLHEVNEGKFEKSRFRFDQLCATSKVLFQLDNRDYSLNEEIINQNIIDEIILTKELPDRRYCLSKLLNFLKKFYSSKEMDLSTQFYAAYNKTAISFCLANDGETSKVECFELLNNFMETFIGSIKESVLYSKLIDLCFLVLEETFYYKELREFMQKAIKEVKESETFIDKGQVISQFNDLLNQLDQKEGRKKNR